MAFARQSGQPLSEVLQWHPRDMDTWLSIGIGEQEDARFAELRKQVNESR